MGKPLLTVSPITRAMRAHDDDEMRLYVLALDAREDAREDR